MLVNRWGGGAAHGLTSKPWHPLAKEKQLFCAAPPARAGVSGMGSAGDEPPRYAWHVAQGLSLGFAWRPLRRVPLAACPCCLWTPLGSASASPEPFVRKAL